jgi:Ala-tRNA(Pro) deacylase
MPDLPDDGTAHVASAATPDVLFRRLESLGIPYTTVKHPAVFTVEEARALRGPIDGSHTKNLFLRDKKGAMWLVVLPEDRDIDLQDLAVRIGAKRLSFGSAERLMKNLGVIPGAVTPFGVVNDRDRAVRIVIDRAVLDHEPLNFHPLDNAMTTSIGADDFIAFLEAEEHAPQIIDFERRVQT